MLHHNSQPNGKVRARRRIVADIPGRPGQTRLVVGAGQEMSIVDAARHGIAPESLEGVGVAGAAALDHYREFGGDGTRAERAAGDAVHTSPSKLMLDWPRDLGGGLFQLSDGRTVEGADMAREEQNRINGLTRRNSENGIPDGLIEQSDDQVFGWVAELDGDPQVRAKAAADAFADVSDRDSLVERLRTVASDGLDDVTPPVTEKATVPVPDGSADEVLAWVDGDPDRAAAAKGRYDGEKGRKTLVEDLDKIIDGGTS